MRAKKSGCHGRSKLLKRSCQSGGCAGTYRLWVQPVGVRSAFHSCWPATTAGKIVCRVGCRRLSRPTSSSYTKAILLATNLPIFLRINRIKQKRFCNNLDRIAGNHPVRPEYLANSSAIQNREMLRKTLWGTTSVA